MCIRDSEKIEKLDLAFKKIKHLETRLHAIDNGIVESQSKLANLDKVKMAWEDKIDKQKDVYRSAVEDCRLEEKNIAEMGLILERLRYFIFIFSIQPDELGEFFELFTYIL